MRATYSPSTLRVHHMSLCQGLRSISTNRRRTVSQAILACSASLTISPASNSRVQRPRSMGGFEQSVATSSASSLPKSVRLHPSNRKVVARNLALLGQADGDFVTLTFYLDSKNTRN